MSGITEIQHGQGDREYPLRSSDWSLYQRLRSRYPDMPVLDPIHERIAQEGSRLECPFIADQSWRAGVKVSVGGADLYLSPISQPCIDQECHVYLWDDEPGGDFWIQHGDNPESVRKFPRRFLLARSLACNVERPDILDWVMDCHEYARSGQTAMVGG